MLEFGQQVEEQGGLAHPRLRHQRKKSAIRLDPVIKRRKGFAMARTEIKISRVGGHTEGLLSKAEKFQKHELPLLPADGIVFVGHVVANDFTDAISVVASVQTVMSISV